MLYEDDMYMFENGRLEESANKSPPLLLAPCKHTTTPPGCVVWGGMSTVERDVGGFGRREAQW